MTYKIKSGSQFPQSKAQAIGETLQSIAEQKGGLSAADVVEAATDEESVLHPHFEWDDIRAAHLFREVQAREMVRAVVVIIQQDEKQEEVRAFHCVRTPQADPEQPEKRYVTLAAAKKNPDFGEQIIASAKKELEQWEHKHSAYRTMFPRFTKEFKPVLEFIDKGKEKDSLEERMPWPENHSRITRDDALGQRV